MSSALQRRGNPFQRLRGGLEAVTEHRGLQPPQCGQCIDPAMAEHVEQHVSGAAARGVTLTEVRSAVTGDIAGSASLRIEATASGSRLVASTRTPGATSYPNTVGIKHRGLRKQGLTLVFLLAKVGERPTRSACLRYSGIVFRIKGLYAPDKLCQRPLYPVFGYLRITVHPCK